MKFQLFRQCLLVGLGASLLCSCSNVRLLYFSVQSVQGENAPQSGTLLLEENVQEQINPLTQQLIPTTDISGTSGNGTSQGSGGSSGTGKASSGNIQNTGTPTVPGVTEPRSGLLATQQVLSGATMYFANGSRTTLNKQGETVQLYVVLLDSQGNKIDLSKEKIIYESSMPQSISVDQNGLVKALDSSGSVKITAKLASNPNITTSLLVVMGTPGDGTAPVDPNSLDGVQGIIDFS